MVVMTPTMSEYFEAWKNSRFVAGDKAKEKAFVAASRLQDIADILGGLDLVYDNIEDQIETVDEQQAEQTGDSLDGLIEFAEKLREEEAGGQASSPARRPTPSAARPRAARRRSPAQISQAAGQLNIKLEN